MSDSFFERVFNNDILVEKIFDYIMERNDTIRELKMMVKQRTINKTTNRAMRLVFRKSYRILHIKLVHVRTNQISFGSKDLPMLVNRTRMNINDFECVGRNLRSYGDWKTEELHIKGTWCFKQNCDKTGQKWLHFKLRLWITPACLKVMVGMWILCPDGCDWCSDISESAQELGPLQFEMITKTSFRRLSVIRVTEQSLRAYSSKCSKDTDNKLKCMEKLEKFITGNIECDQLIIEMVDKESFTTRQTSFDQMPQEMIEQMISAWKVKKLKIEIQEERLENFCWVTFENTQYFNLIRIFAPNVANVTKSRYVLQELELDTTKAGSVCIRKKFSNVQQQISTYVKNLKTLYNARRTKVKLFFDSCEISSTDFQKNAHDAINQVEHIKVEEMELRMRVVPFPLENDEDKRKVMEFERLENNWTVENESNHRHYELLFRNGMNNKTFLVQIPTSTEIQNPYPEDVIDFDNLDF